jgi:hypothetical protein
VKAKSDHQQPHIEMVCHPEQSEGSVFALAFLAVIPEGNLLLPYFSQENDAFLSKEAFARAMAVEPSWRTNSSACRKTPSE